MISSFLAFLDFDVDNEIGDGDDDTVTMDSVLDRFGVGFLFDLGLMLLWRLEDDEGKGDDGAKVIMVRTGVPRCEL